MKERRKGGGGEEVTSRTGQGLAAGRSQDEADRARTRPENIHGRHKVVGFAATGPLGVLGV